MNAQDIIREVQENASEWLDEVPNIHDKHLFVMNILAQKLSQSFETIDYLKKRIDHAGKIYVKN